MRFSKSTAWAFGLVLLLAVAGWQWFSATYRSNLDSQNGASGTDTGALTDSSAGTIANATTDGNTDSPFATQSGVSASDSQSNASTSALASSASNVNGTEGNLSQRTELPPIDMASIGANTLSDDEYEALVARLKTDPALLQQFIDEFRQEQDPARQLLLARLLGEAGGVEVTLAASELIYSGDEASRQLGLNLLQQVQPGNAYARDIVSGLLATEIEPQVLVDTMTTLARPGSVDDDSRNLLADQVALLSSHDDARVRGISLDILSRWSTDGRDTPVLLAGLDDGEERVRSAAAYALVGHENTSAEVIDALFSVARNTDEEESVRRATVLALKGMPLSEQQRVDLVAIERELDTVVR